MSRTIADSFDARVDGIGFLRWVLAVLVVLALAGPLAGFYGGRELGLSWSSEQSVAGVAVGGFFFLTGFLLTMSRRRRPVSTPRFLWRRLVRVVPAFWLALLVTAFVLAPLAWWRERGSLDGFLDPGVTDSPLTYVWNNLFLVLRQHDIAGLGASNPLTALGAAPEWNGSAGTLAYGVGAVLLLVVLAMAGGLRFRAVGGGVAGAVILLAAAQSLGAGDVSRAAPLFADPRVLLLGAPFAFGILVALFAERIPVTGALALAAAVVAIAGYVGGGWLVIGQYAFFYAMLWFAARVTRFDRWNRVGDFSFGIYLIAWPLMQLAAVFGLHQQGRILYHVVVLVGCHLYAAFSWHVVEKPALAFRDWRPRPVGAVVDRIRPLVARIGRGAGRVLGIRDRSEVGA